MDMEAHSILEPSLCFPLIFDGGASKKLWPLSTNGGIKKKKNTILALILKKEL